MGKGARLKGNTGPWSKPADSAWEPSAIVGSRDSQVTWGTEKS